MCAQNIVCGIGPLHNQVTWYGINYTGTQVTQWDVQNKGTCTNLARLSFVLNVPLRDLHPSVIYSVPCDRIVQRAYCDASEMRAQSIVSGFILRCDVLKRGRERRKLRSSTRLTIISLLPVKGLIVNASEQLKTSEFQYKLAASATSALHASKTFTEHHFVRVTPSCNKS